MKTTNVGVARWLTPPQCPKRRWPTYRSAGVRFGTEWFSLAEVIDRSLSVKTRNGGGICIGTGTGTAALADPDGDTDDDHERRPRGVTQSRKHQEVLMRIAAQASRMFLSGRVVAGVLVLAGAALAADPSQTSSPHLTLHLPLAADVLPRVGPTPEVVGACPGQWLSGDGQGALRLAPETLDGHARVVHSPPEPLLRFPAQAILSNAHGAVSFWIRAPRVLDPNAKDFPLLLQLIGGNGGTWTFAARETPYVAANKTLDAQDARAQAEKSLLPETQGTGREAKHLDADPVLDLDRKDPPAAALQCRVSMTLWPEGEASMTVGGSAPSAKAREWHHVLWTWRSLHHDLYIDGQPVGGDEPQNRISRMAPMAGDEARLEILRCSADLRDLRLFNRWLSAEDVGRLAAGLKAGESLAELPPARVWADWASSTGRSVVYVDAGGVAKAESATVRCIDVREGKPVGEAKRTGLPDRLGEIVMRPFDPVPFPASTYRYEVVLQDKAGNEVGRAVSADWHCEPPTWPFLGFAGGRPEAAKTPVIPPFTAVTVEGQVVGTVLREHRIARDGLFASVMAAGRELLAEPIRLNVVVAGKPLAFDQGPGVGEVRHTVASADWQAETRGAEGLALNVAAHLEYDGVTRFDVTLTPGAPAKLDRVELVIPFSQDIVRLCHSGNMMWFGAISRAADGAWSCRRTNWAGPGAERERRPGVLFDAFDQTLGLFPPPLRQPCTPYMHIGNDQRGLSWFVDNDQNWVNDPTIPPLEFVAQGDVPFLRLNLVARPVRLDAPVTWRFYLLANPFKPLPPKWRTWGVGQNRRSNELTKQSTHLFWWHWSEYAKGFRPYPGPAVSYDGKATAGNSDAAVPASGGTYDEWRDKFKSDDVRHLPFINFGTPGGFPGFTPECMLYPYTWKLHNNQPHRDYVAYWLDRCVRDIGIDGVYIDEPYSEPSSYNVLAGDAPYIRSDGTRAIGFRYMEGREYIRRLKQLFTDHGIDYSIWLHNTNYRALPVMTFADIGMDGEHPSIWVPEFDNYHGFYNAPQSRGYIAGAAYGFVGAQMFHGNTNPKGDDAFARIYRKCRTYLAVTLPNGVLPMSTSFSDELDRIQNIHAAFGLATQEPEELNAEEVEAQCSGLTGEPRLEGVTALRLRAQNRSLLYLSMSSRENPSPNHVLGDATPLGCGKPYVHLWNAESGTSLREDGQWRLGVPPQGFACVWAEGRDQPQPDRPPGVLLGVSFDRGMEADCGGGLLPVATTSGVALPAPVAGRVGLGLAVGPAIAAPAYPVVPSWAEGAVQFDLKMERAVKRPLTLLRLEHHLDCELQLVARDDAPGLLLTARETPLVLPVPAAAYASGNPAAVTKTVFAKLPAARSDAWRRIVLTWQAGRYRLYCDGKEIAALLDPAAPRLRDAQAPVRGVQFGDGAGHGSGGGAVMDSAWVYTWALSAMDVKAAQDAVAPASVAPAGGGEAFTVWHDAAAREQLRVGAAFGVHQASSLVTHVRFTLLPGGVDSGKPVAVGEAIPWCGTAWGSLAMKTPEQSSTLLAELGEKAAVAAPTYRLRVELLQRRGKDAGGDKILAVQEQPLELDPFSDIDAEP
jgi:hypothetical protein